MSRISNSGSEFFHKIALNGEPKLPQKVCHESDLAGENAGGTLSKDPEAGKAKAFAVSKETSHRVGEGTRPI